MGGQYANLRELAKENFDANDEIRTCYGSWASMQRHLQLPDQLSCSIDLATGTGKSYVLRRYSKGLADNLRQGTSAEYRQA